MQLVWKDRLSAHGYDRVSPGMSDRETRGSQSRYQILPPSFTMTDQQLTHSHTYLNIMNKLSVPGTEELASSEIAKIDGGSRLSLDAFRLIGMAFEQVNQASMVGAPRGNTYRHSG